MTVHWCRLRKRFLSFCYYVILSNHQEILSRCQKPDIDLHYYIISAIYFELYQPQICDIGDESQQLNAIAIFIFVLFCLNFHIFCNPLVL